MKYESGIGLLVIAAVLCSTPASAQKQPDPPPDMKAAIQGAMEAADKEQYEPGPVKADWNKGGVDIQAVLAGKPGGFARNYLLTTNKDGERNVTIFTSAPAATFVPKSWKLVSRTGNIDGAAANGTLDFGSVEGRYYLVVRTGAKRVGNAYCSSAPVGAELYERPGSDKGDMPPEVMPFIFQAAIEMESRRTVCQRFDAQGSGYAVRHFLEDGRSLPALDGQGNQVGIVPAAPISDLLEHK